MIPQLDLEKDKVWVQVTADYNFHPTAGIKQGEIFRVIRMGRDAYGLGTFGIRTKTGREVHLKHAWVDILCDEREVKRRLRVQNPRRKVDLHG